MKNDFKTTAMRKVSRRIVFFLFLIFVFNQMDRVNISFAALRMNVDLGFDAEVYGFGASILFVSYLLFEIPSNFAMRYVGARIWLAGLVISWGLISTAMAAISGPKSFYVLRFLLGASEAGFVPGCILYLTRWLPEERRCIELSKIGMAIAVAVIVGGPVSGLLLTFDSIAGLAGWQWIFVVEGLPSIVLGVLTLSRLSETPATATWLSPAERQWLTAEIDREQAEIGTTGSVGLGALISDRRLWAIGLTFFGASMSTYGIVYWLPQILKQLSGLSDFQTSLLSTLPYVAYAFGMYFFARHSDRRQERHAHFSVAALTAALGLLLAASTNNPWAGFFGLLIVGIGLGGVIGVFWAIPMGFLTGTAGVAGFALINMFGSSAGFVSPLLVGAIRQSTGSFAAGLYALAGFMLLSAALAFFARRKAP